MAGTRGAPWAGQESFRGDERGPGRIVNFSSPLFTHSESSYLCGVRSRSYLFFYVYYRLFLSPGRYLLQIVFRFEQIFRFIFFSRTQTACGSCLLYTLCLVLIFRCYNFASLSASKYVFNAICFFSSHSCTITVIVVVIRNNHRERTKRFAVYAGCRTAVGIIRRCKR